MKIERGVHMDLENIVQLFINNGTAIGVLIYFIFRDYKFNTQLSTTLAVLLTTVNSIKELLERGEE